MNKLFALMLTIILWSPQLSIADDAAAFGSDAAGNPSITAPSAVELRGEPVGEGGGIIYNPPSACLASVTCLDGSSVSCSGFYTCIERDPVCEPCTRDRGSVTCDGVTTACDAICPLNTSCKYLCQPNGGSCSTGTCECSPPSP
ncbi:MAG: hypothetical protein HC897_15730 [Thermoanaerobaculia bacterium]|nr:hypothetical protein [Thermoanaerobaculia bacterium]